MDDERAVSLAQLRKLVQAFATNIGDELKPTYNETQARTDFISPLLSAFGWDVNNTKRLPASLREVVEEANVAIADDAPARRPDYELRLARLRKMFVEAKKPSVDIERDARGAFQARRYGYSAGMPIVVLTNFRQLAVFDTSEPPVKTDGPQVARIALFEYTDYEACFDDLWEFLSREVVYSGRFDEIYTSSSVYRGSRKFDELFLEQVRRWRMRLAVDVHAHVPSLTAPQLTYAVQVFLLRLIFLRICEDRSLEKYEQLRDAAQSGGLHAYADLLKKADGFYNSGLFDVVTDARLGTVVGESVLLRIIDELYYPNSPYTFSVVEPEVLGEIYEQFLGEVISVQRTAVQVIQRPEVRESGGVIPTPRQVVDEIVDRTLYPLLTGKGPRDLDGFTVLDMSCGSGVFLLSAYERLCEHYLQWYIADGIATHRGKTIIEVKSDTWRLSFAERRAILLRHIRGVDIDADAVEVAQFSLLLKLVEGESQADLKSFVDDSGVRALPRLDIIKSGNSLVGREEWRSLCGTMDEAVEATVRPFDWEQEFPGELAAGGFSAIVGNPPYIRIQNMAKYSPDEVRYYEDQRSPYTTAHQDNFDKYALFIERALSLLDTAGQLGFIVPHKFMSITAGRSVRELLADRVSNIIHFGSQQVFTRTSNYTAIVIVGPPSTSPVVLETVSSIKDWRLAKRLAEVQVPRNDMSNAPWILMNGGLVALLDKLYARGARPLGKVADIFVGLQTSADDVYIVDGDPIDDDTIRVTVGGVSYDMEAALLKPCLMDVPIAAYVQPVANRWMILPYNIADGKARLIQPDIMEHDYPECWRYLSQHLERLKRRSITGGRIEDQQLYQFGRSQSLLKFGKEKILFPILSLEPKYALDKDDIRVTGGGNGPYYLLRSEDSSVSNLALLAILNHPLSEAVVRSRTSVFRGGYYSHGKQFIQGIPVPALSQRQEAVLAAGVQDVIDSKAELAQALTPGETVRAERLYRDRRGVLNSMVDQAFGLGEDDRQVIESVPMP